MSFSGFLFIVVFSVGLNAGRQREGWSFAQANLWPLQRQRKNSAFASGNTRPLNDGTCFQRTD